MDERKRIHTPAPAYLPVVSRRAKKCSHFTLCWAGPDRERCLLRGVSLPELVYGYVIVQVLAFHAIPTSHNACDVSAHLYDMMSGFHI